MNASPICAQVPFPLSLPTSCGEGVQEDSFCQMVRYEQYRDALHPQFTHVFADFSVTYPPQGLTEKRISTEQQRIVNTPGADWLLDLLCMEEQGQNPWQDVREVEDC